MSGTAYIALGGNLGNVEQTMRQAIEQLRESKSVDVVNCSGLYCTSPIGAQAGDHFLNAVICVQTSFTPEELLSLCQTIENKLGRVRDIHWGPRNIDLDLIAFDDLVIHSKALSLPHPACWYRRFVLDPMTEIAPEWLHPQRKTTVVELQTRLLNRPLILDLSCCDSAFIASAVKVLKTAFTSQELSLVTGNEKENSEPPTWKILEQTMPQWENSETVSRMDLSHLSAPTEQALIDMIRSAIDAPQRTADFD